MPVRKTGSYSFLVEKPNKSLEILQSDQSISARQTLEKNLRAELKKLWALPNVGDIRQVGLVAGIELVKNWETREPFHLRERVGIRICEAMAKRGVLTRPIGNVIVILPPYCMTRKQVAKMISAFSEAVSELLSPFPSPINGPGNHPDRFLKFPTPENI